MRVRWDLGRMIIISASWSQEVKHKTAEKNSIFFSGIKVLPVVTGSGFKCSISQYSLDARHVIPTTVKFASHSVSLSKRETEQLFCCQGLRYYSGCNSKPSDHTVCLLPQPYRLVFVYFCKILVSVALASEKKLTALKT